MLLETVIHSFSDCGCYVRATRGTKPWECEVLNRVLCELHRPRIEAETERYKKEFDVQPLHPPKND